MRRVVVTTSVTLDGVMQAPGRADEDVRGGFEHGSQALPYDDEVKAKAMGRGMAQTGAMLFGRRTYEDFYSVWPHRTGNPLGTRTASEVRRVQNPHRAAALAELDPAEGGRRRLRRRPQAAARAGSRRHRQWSAGAVTGAPRAGRRVCAPHPPAGLRLGQALAQRGNAARATAAPRRRLDRHRDHSATYQPELSGGEIRKDTGHDAVSAQHLSA